MAESEKPLFKITEQRRYIYDPDEFFETHARFYTAIIMQKIAFDQRDLPLPEVDRNNFRWALAIFASALEYPVDPALSERMRELGDGAKTVLETILDGSGIDLSAPHDYRAIYDFGNLEALISAVKTDLVCKGGIDELRMYCLK
ncbi:hypothetical protein A2154_03880 [Candidatus Gottesmanbacteria bacterium RBG_16_43_7]|uniref:Uncharacterized protein n=1 Tax=Candidatus Gottesmanbacteria bacterium RBG_16_43_7 TaxID=1798373 RepID=A0A1F5Z9V8_9BACT|nr:MAG: hypothetical protein A2154_03880 [Candidatus Gottesmanbacteria bacterium RBG_16_43_7]